MNRIRGYIRGYIRVKITGASPDQVLNRLLEHRIMFWALHHIDAFSLQFSIYSSDIVAAREIVHRCLCEIEFEEFVGFRDVAFKITARWLLLLGLVLSTAAVMIGQNYLMFFSVSGNETVSKVEILQALDTLDVHFGTPGPKVKPKYIKDHVLNMMPQLQWITVTQNGSVARVVVRERPDTPKPVERRVLANIVASKHAMITEQSVFEGQALKLPGDLVSQGEMLVSGVVDLEKKFLIVRARAEIIGQTWYQKTVLTPEKCLNKEVQDRSDWCIWLEIGKRRIKILGNSRIYDTNCDKMIIRNVITLPGGNQLPVAIMAEQRTYYTVDELRISKDVAAELLCDQALRSVEQEMYAGKIVKHEYIVDNINGCHRLQGDFVCHEMIAQVVEGKWNNEDFQND